MDDNFKLFRLMEAWQEYGEFGIESGTGNHAFYASAPEEPTPEKGDPVWEKVAEHLGLDPGDGAESLIVVEQVFFSGDEVIPGEVVADIQRIFGHMAVTKRELPGAFFNLSALEILRWSRKDRRFEMRPASSVFSQRDYLDVATAAGKMPVAAE